MGSIQAQECEQSTEDVHGFHGFFSDMSEVTEFSTLSVNERGRHGRENPRKKEFVHMHESEQRRSEGSRSGGAIRPCWICNRTDHLIRNCDEFRQMNIAERLKEMDRQKLCVVCLNKHGGGRYPSKIQCIVRSLKRKSPSPVASGGRIGTAAESEDGLCSNLPYDAGDAPLRQEEVRYGSLFGRRVICNAGG